MESATDTQMSWDGQQKRPQRWRRLPARYRRVIMEAACRPTDIQMSVAEVLPDAYRGHELQHLKQSEEGRQRPRRPRSQANIPGSSWPSRRRRRHLHRCLLCNCRLSTTASVGVTDQQSRFSVDCYGCCSPLIPFRFQRRRPTVEKSRVAVAVAELPFRVRLETHFEDCCGC